MKRYRWEITDAWWKGYYRLTTDAGYIRNRPHYLKATPLNGGEGAYWGFDFAKAYLGKRLLKRPYRVSYLGSPCICMAKGHNLSRRAWRVK